eukprot:1000038-Amphidinium_carterae.1
MINNDTCETSFWKLGSCGESVPILATPKAFWGSFVCGKERGKQSPSRLHDLSDNALPDLKTLFPRTVRGAHAANARVTSCHHTESTKHSFCQENKSQSCHACM